MSAPQRGPRSTRRDILRAGSGLLAGTGLAGCDLLSTSPDDDRDTGTGDGGRDAEQAPDLAKRVQDGDLPRLSERLPNEPLVITPTDSLGVYGGTWRSALEGSADTSWCWYTIGYDPLLRWNLEWTDVIPNVAREVETLDDGREFIIHLRAGMKWSDGEPFTSADILFAYNDVLLNEELATAPPAAFVIDQTPARFEAIDEYTVQVRFIAPNGLFTQRLASGDGMDLCMHPKHYLEEYHIDHNPDAAQRAEDEGQADWVELFESKTSVSGIWNVEYWQNPELPTICAWHITTPPGSSSQVVAERNPYYWKTDPEGRQLPYLDRVVYDVVENPEVILLQATNGEFNMYARHLNIPENKPVLAAERENAGFEFFDLRGANMNAMIIAFNLTHEDPALREVFRNKDFRIGLSHAIDRDELITTIHQSIGEPWQAAPRPESALYDEELAKQYTDYDPDLANEHLDAAGYSDRDADGLRLRPDGEPLVISVSVQADDEGWVEALELVNRYWADVGVELRIDTLERSLFEERAANNEVQASVWSGDGGMRDALMDPRWYFPFSDRSYFAVRWAQWYESDGAAGEEPPAPVRRQMELFNEVKATPDEEQQRNLMMQVLQIARDEFYVIGTALPGPGFGIVKNDFHNVPAEFVDSSIYNAPGPTRPEQYYIEAGDS